MTTQEGPKRKNPAARSDSETRIALERARAEAKAAERARLKAEEALAGNKATLAAAQAEIEQERQARSRAEQARVEAESALAKAKNTLPVETETAEALPSALGEPGAEQRVSFIVRLTVDERGHPRRTEIQHAGSGEKAAFPGLDGKSLAVFMQGCLSPLVAPQSNILAAPSASLVEAPAVQPPGPAASLEAPALQAFEPATRLAISAVAVYRAGAPGAMALALNAAETYVLQVCFQLEGPEALSLAAGEPSYDLQVYAHEVTTGASILLNQHAGNLVQGVLEYRHDTLISDLRRGLCRLRTLITLQTPTKMAAHFEGPIINIS